MGADLGRFRAGIENSKTPLGLYDKSTPITYSKPEPLKRFRFRKSLFIIHIHNDSYLYDVIYIDIHSYIHIHSQIYNLVIVLRIMSKQNHILINKIPGHTKDI